MPDVHWKALKLLIAMLLEQPPPRLDLGGREMALERLVEDGHSVKEICAALKLNRDQLAASLWRLAH